MTAELRPYPDYVDSGRPRLGAIPAHWDVRRNGRLFAQRNQTGFGDLPILEVSLKTGVRVRDMENLARKQVMSDRAKYKRAAKGDIAYNMMRMWQGAVGVAPVDGLVSPAYVVAQPYPEADSRYFSYLFRTAAYMAEVDGYSRGIVKDRNRLYWDDFKRMPSCFPPTEEQKAIADYLDANASLVRKFIRNRRRMIEVLSEQKQRLTQGAITSSSTKLHRMRDLVADPRREVERVEGQEYTPIGLNNWGRGIFHKTPTRGQDLGDSVFFWLEEGDLVFSGQFAWEGAVSVARRKDHRCVASHRYPVFVSKTTSVRTSYLESFFQSSAGQLLMDVNSRGAAGRNRPLNPRTLLRELIPVPSMDEQLAIEEFGNHLQRVSDVIGRQIALIHEFRTRLIADVVTGKLDVRHLAPAPKDIEPDALEPIDGEEEDFDDELTDGEEADLEEVAHADD
jgi:type I restriction enzyme S subunit